MKTVKQHAESLPPKIRTVFLKEIKKQRREHELSDGYDNLSEAINYPIRWDNTNKGQLFWETLFNKIKSDEKRQRTNLETTSSYTKSCYK